MKIGIKFCGNCNPFYDTGVLLRDIKANMPEANWLPADSPEKDVLLVISGCTADCAARPEWSGPTIVVAGETVDAKQYLRADLPMVVTGRLEVIRNEMAGNI